MQVKGTVCVLSFGQLSLSVPRARGAVVAGAILGNRQNPEENMHETPAAALPGARRQTPAASVKGQHGFVVYTLGATRPRWGDDSMLKTPLATGHPRLVELLLIAALNRCGAACKMRLPIKLHGVEMYAIG